MMKNVHTNAHSPPTTAASSCMATRLQSPPNQTPSHAAAPTAGLSLACAKTPTRTVPMKPGTP
jgi:hypothetical protein